MAGEHRSPMTVSADTQPAADVGDVYSSRVEEILAAATGLFSARGYRAVGIRLIADTVGVQPSSLYHHFSSKEEILYRIALRATRDFIDAHAELLEQRDDVPAALRTVVHRHVLYFGRNRLAQQVADRELRELTPEHYEDVRSRQRAYLDALVDLVDHGRRRRQLHVDNPAVATRAFLDVLNYFNRWFEPRPDLDLDALGRLYSSMIVDGFLRASDGRTRRSR